jgi:hypothetical protein
LDVEVEVAILAVLAGRGWGRSQFPNYNKKERVVFILLEVL